MRMERFYLNIYLCIRSVHRAQSRRNEYFNVSLSLVVAEKPNDCQYLGIFLCVSLALNSNCLFVHSEAEIQHALETRKKEEKEISFPSSEDHE